MTSDIQYVLSSAAPLFFPIVAVVGALIHSRRARSGALEVWQRWWLIVATGCGAAWVGISFLVAPDYMADSIGFATASPFQFEIAFANLAFAVIAVMAALRHPEFRLTFGLGYGVFLWPAAMGHIYQWFAHGDHAAGNTGGILVYDFAIPAVIVGLALVARLRNGRATHQATEPRVAM